MKLKIQHLLPGLVSGGQRFKVILSFTECEAELETPTPKNICQLGASLLSLKT